MRCPACHQLVSSTARFCSACGASLALAPPVQYATPVETVYTPLPYTPPASPQGSSVSAVPFAPVPYPASYPAPYPRGPLQAPAEEAYAPHDYAIPVAMPAYAAPAPAPPPAPFVPSMVNNVTVTQVTPPSPVVVPSVVVTGGGGDLGVALRALYLLLGGIFAGATWVAVVASGGEAWAFLFAVIVTAVVLLADIAILTRYPHR